jgi:hypothetical protein
MDFEFLMKIFLFASVSIIILMMYFNNDNLL